MSGRVFINREELARLWMAGVSSVEISRQLGVSEGAVSAAGKRYNLPSRALHLHGAETRIDQDLFRKCWEDNVTTIRMGEMFGVSGSTVSQIARRLGLSPRLNRANAAHHPKPQQIPAPPPRRHAKTQPDIATMTGRLLATKGKYEAIEIIRRAEGWTPAQAMQRYHAARAGR